MGRAEIDFKQNRSEKSAAKLRGGQRSEVAEAEAAAQRSPGPGTPRRRRSSSTWPPPRVPPGRDVLVLTEVVLRHRRERLPAPARTGAAGARRPQRGGQDHPDRHDRRPARPAYRERSICGCRPGCCRSGCSCCTTTRRCWPRWPPALPRPTTNTLRARLARFLLDAATLARPVGTLVGRRAVPGHPGRAAAGRAGTAAADPRRADQQPRPGQRRASSSRLCAASRAP